MIKGYITNFIVQFIGVDYIFPLPNSPFFSCIEMIIYFSVKVHWVLYFCLQSENFSVLPKTLWNVLCLIFILIETGW